MTKQQIESIAQKIVKQLEKDSNPANSTWGLAYPEAHDSLFNDNFEDMVETVINVLVTEI